MNFMPPFPSQQSFPNNNWEQLYNRLLFSYYELSENYRTAVNQNLELTQELKKKEQLFHQAQKLLSESSSKVVAKNTSTQDSHLSDQTIKEGLKNQELRNLRKERSQRKSKSTITNQYMCTYPECNRCYDSSVSLNLHIKLKHNGGTKKQRETYAKMILDAQEKGLEIPKININFPPNFLEDFRISYQYMKKYSM